MQENTSEELTSSLFLSIADHTLLAPETTPEELEEFLLEAKLMGVKRVCVSPSMLPVENEGLEVVTVVGFPSGVHKAEVKAFEAATAVADGADEIDMVVNPSFVHSGDWNAVTDEVARVKKACGGQILKVILETASLTPEQITLASKASVAGGADFVKTSTGFHKAGGASVEAVENMVKTVAGDAMVKASGGIRTAADAQKMWDAGAKRFGVSATAQIVSELRGEISEAKADSSY